MASGQSQHYYLSYLLRLWPTGDGEEKVWRASLESPGSGERHGFASLEDLLHFLQTQIEQVEGRDIEDTKGD